MSDSRYLQIAGGYAWAPLRVGLVLRNPAGSEVYCRPGDDETAMREELEALEEAIDGMAHDKAAALADMALGEYFADVA